MIHVSRFKQVIIKQVIIMIHVFDLFLCLKDHL